MNQVKASELVKLNCDYYAGASQDIIYRCFLVGSFIMSISFEYLEINKEEVVHTYDQWVKSCEEINVDMIDMLIYFYSGDKEITTNTLKFYEKYTIIFEKMVDYLLGKVMWNPPTDVHLAAVNCSNDLTAQVLTDIYSKY